MSTFGIITYVTDRLPETELAYLMINPDLREHCRADKVLFLSSSISYATQRVLLAYSLAYFICDFDSERTIEFYKVFSKDCFESEASEEVRNIALELLLPSALFKHLCHRYRNISRYDLILKLVSTFNVPTKLIQLRLTSEKKMKS